MTRKTSRKKTWSSGQEWDGFHPTAYSLSRAWELPIERLVKDSSGEVEAEIRTPTSIGEAFKLFNWGRDEHDQPIQVGKPIGKIKSTFGRGREYVLTVESPSGQERFCGSGFSVELLEALLRLGKASVNPFEASLFFYDSDSSTHDPADKYDFFVVRDDRIVQEAVRFSDSRHSGFDPSIFSAPDEDDPFSIRENAKFEAWLSYWYRKFYTETRTGQLMVFRPDEPPLYFYPDGRWRWGSISAVARLEQKLRNVSYLLVALVVIALLSLIHWWH
ncbi:MAG: hypothetical protein EPN47_13425 [Acidobacteria bacterium]|nr:MAG: hypothetical protein EPN47_13425 [Acidobacteriota bacterium]